MCALNRILFSTWGVASFEGRREAGRFLIVALKRERTPHEFIQPFHDFTHLFTFGNPPG